MASFWRFQSNSIDVNKLMLSSSTIICPDELKIQLRPKDCILLSDWNNSERLGYVYAFGVVKSINATNDSPEVIWKPSEVVLKPNPAGVRFWRDKVFFKFANAVRHRYMLDDLMAEHFPELDVIEFDKNYRASSSTSGNRTYQVVEGFVYLIKSEFGYKIGKTVNIKNRTRLFEVKLPFPIELLHYARFENYSKAETDLHRKFANKRLEGEWFDLSQTDIDYIKSLGTAMPIDGL